MKKYLFIFCVLSSCFAGSFAQAPWKFRSDNYLGFDYGAMGRYKPSMAFTNDLGSLV
jgi:hypothetical protein